MLTVHQQQLELYKQNAAQHGGPWGQPGGNDSHALPMRLLLAREEEENIIAMMHPDAPPEAMGPVVQPPQTENNIFSNLCAESSGSGNRLLHDSQVQLHLLEQQNKKSVLVGKEEQDRLATIHLDELPSEASNPLSVRPSQSATSLSKPIEQSSDALSATPVLGTYPIDADDDPDGIYNVSDEEIERQTKRSNHRRRQQQLVDCLPQSPFIFSAPLSSGTSIPVQSHPALITNLAPTPQRSSHESSKKISASKLVHSSSSTGAQQKLTMVSQGTQTDCWLLRALLEPSGREPAAQQPLSYPSRYSTEGESQDGQEPHNQSLPYPEFTDLDSLLAAPASIETWQSTEDQTHLSQEDDEWPAYVPGWSSTFVDFDPTFRISNFAPSPYIQSQHRGADQDTQPHQDRPQQLQSDDYPYNHMYPSTPYYSPYLNCISEMNAEPWPILQSLPSPSPEDEFPCQQEDGTEANQEVQTHQGHPQQPQSDYYYPYIHTYCSSPYYAAFPNLHERGIDETNAAPSVPDSPLQPSRSQPAYSEDYDQSSDYEDDKEETAEADDEATESEQNENEHGKKRFPHKPSPLRLWNGRPRLGSTAPGSSCQAFAMHERLNGSVEEKEGKMFDIRKGMKGKEKANASAIEEKEKEKEELATIPQFVRTVDGDDCSIPVHPEVALFNLLDTDVEDHDLGRLWEAVEEFRSALELYEVTVDKLCRRQSLTVGEMYRIFGFTDVGLRPWRGTTEAENDATNMPTKVNRTVARNDGHGEGNSRAAVHSNALPTSSGYEDCAMEESSDESEDRDWVMVGR